MNEERITNTAIQLHRCMTKADRKLHVAIFLYLGDPLPTLDI